MNLNLRRSPCWKGVALLALVSVLSGAWLTVVHGSLVEGGACPAETDSSLAPLGVTIGQGHGPVAHHDCYICRWLRSLRSMTGDAPPAFAAMVPAGLVHPDPIVCLAHLRLVRIPGRSPPA
jgi:hypothetical protein